MSPASSGAISRAQIVRITAVTAFVAVFALAVPTAAEASSTPPSVAQMTQYVVDGTNAVRAKQGLAPLVRNAALDKVAADWAHQQWLNGAMSHNPNYSKQIPAGWQRAGENVGKGYTYTQIVNAWVASSSHYANLVNDYTSVGVGYFEQDGKRYWSEVFAKYPGVKPSPAPSSGSAGTAPSTTPSPAPSTPAPTKAPTPTPPPTKVPAPTPTPIKVPTPTPPPTKVPAPTPTPTRTSLLNLGSLLFGKN